MSASRRPRRDSASCSRHSLLDWKLPSQAQAQAQAELCPRSQGASTLPSCQATSPEGSMDHVLGAGGRKARGETVPRFEVRTGFH